MVSLVGFLLRNVAKGIEVLLFYFLRLSDFRFSQWIIVYVLDFFTVGLANATLKLASYFSRGSCTIKMALNWQKPNKGVRNVFLSQKLLITLAENFEFQARLFTLIHFDSLFTPHHTVNFFISSFAVHKGRIICHLDDWHFTDSYVNICSTCSD